jgi:hypothetical protein
MCWLITGTHIAKPRRRNRHAVSKKTSFKRLAGSSVRHRTLDVYPMWPAAVSGAALLCRPRIHHASRQRRAGNPVLAGLAARVVQTTARQYQCRPDTGYDVGFIGLTARSVRPHEQRKMFGRIECALRKVKRCVKILPDLQKIPGHALCLRRLLEVAARSVFVEVKRSLVLPATAAELRAALHHFIEVCLTFLIFSARSAGGEVLGVGVIKAWGHGEPFCLVSQAFRLRLSNTHGFHRLAVFIASSVPAVPHFVKTRVSLGFWVLGKNMAKYFSGQFGAEAPLRASFLHSLHHPARSSANPPSPGGSNCIFSSFKTNLFSRIFLASPLCARLLSHRISFTCHRSLSCKF